MPNHVRSDLSRLGNPHRTILSTWIDLAKRDEKVVFVCADSIWYALGQVDPGIKDWFRERPERMKRMVMCGIQEANAALVAAGLANQGFKVLWSELAWLYERAYNMIACSICIDRYNVTMVGVADGIGGGPTHSSFRDIATFGALPNMIITSPADAVEANRITLFAYNYIGPLYIRAGRTEGNIIFDEGYQFRLGEAPVVRDGDDVAIIALQEWVYKAMLAAEQLAKEGIDARVIDMSTVKPIDEKAIIKAAKETGAVVTAESTNIHGGLGSAVAGVVVENYPVPMKRFALDDLFTQAGQPPKLNEYYRETVSDLVATVRDTVKRKC